MRITYKDILRSFPLYIIAKWKWLGLPPPTKLQLEIAEYLQESGGTWAIIKGFRGIAKSWITASYAEWRWLRNRDTRIMIVSGNQAKADEISLFIRQCIDGWDVLKPLRWADYEKQHIRWGIQQFNVRGAPVDIAPSCKAAGIGGMLVGSRAHLIIGDDVETPGNSETVEARTKLLASIGEFGNILLPGGQVKLLGTPQSEESVYNTLEERGVSCRVWPIRVPEEKDIGIYRDSLSPLIRGEFDKGNFGVPTEPDRFPEDVIVEKAAVITRSAFRLQFMLDTTLADAEKYPLKLNDLITTTLDPATAPLTVVWGGNSKNRDTAIPQLGFTGDFVVSAMFIGDDWRQYERKILVVDPSGRGDNETAWAVMGALAGRYYLLDFGGYMDGYSPKTLESLVHHAMVYSVGEVIYESNFGDGMFGQSLQQAFKGIYNVKITEVVSRGQKEARIIDTLEPVLRAHRLVVDSAAIKRDSEAQQPYSLCYQLSRITRDKGCLKYDDRIDCVSIGVKHMQGVAGVNIKEITTNLKQKQRLDEINSIINDSQWFGKDKKQKGQKLTWQIKKNSIARHLS